MENPYPIIRNSNVLVHPSLVESQGITVLEAMALSVPVIVVDSAGPREYIQNMENGIIMKPDAECFADIRFPDGRNYEDISTVYKIVQKASVTGINEEYYHWRQRANSISHRHNKKDLEDGWIAYKKRYNDLHDCVGNEAEAILLRQCADKIMQVWAWNLKSKCSQERINEMNEFVRKQYPVFGFKEWPLKIRFFFFLTRFNNRVSFTVAYILCRIYRAVKFIIKNNRMDQ